MTSEIDSPHGEVIIVDVEINRIVIDAASARLPLVQDAERRQYGKAHTNLSTLAEEILETWKPGMTKRPPARPQAKCPHCEKMVSTYNTGKLKVHGPTDARCPETFDTKNLRVRDTRPLRFPMNRARYNQIKEFIRSDKQSVASVITQRFAHFARRGHL